MGSFFTLQHQPREVFYEKGTLKTFAKITEKHLCQSYFFNEVADFRPETSLEKVLLIDFPVNFTNF